MRVGGVGGKHSSRSGDGARRVESSTIQFGRETSRRLQVTIRLLQITNTHERVFVRECPFFVLERDILLKLPFSLFDCKRFSDVRAPS